GALALPGEELVQSAQCQLITHIRVERAEIVGRGPGKPGTDIQRANPSQCLAGAAAVAEQLPQRPAKVHPSAQLVGSGIVEGLRQDEGTTVLVHPNRGPAGQRAREQKIAAAQESGAEPRRDRRGQRQRSREGTISLDADWDAQEEPSLAVGQPPNWRAVRIDPEIPSTGQVSIQREHSQRLPGEPRRVLPEMGQRSRRPNQGIVVPRDRYSERGGVRLVSTPARAQANSGWDQTHIGLFQTLTELAAAQPLRQPLNQPAE